MRPSSAARKSVTALPFVFGFLLLAAIAAAAGTTARPTAPRPTTSVPRCATSGLVVWLDTNGDGAAGSAFYNLKFTNLSGRTCTLLGHPGISAVSLAGHQLGSPASRDPAHASRTITLTNGSTASAVLRIVQAANFPNSTCHLVTAAGVRVFPPNETAAKVIPFPFNACSRVGPIYLTIEAVARA